MIVLNALMLTNVEETVGGRMGVAGCMKKVNARMSIEYKNGAGTIKKVL